MSTTRNLVAAVGYGPGWLIAQAKPINSFYSCVSRQVFISINYRNICSKLSKVQYIEIARATVEIIVSLQVDLPCYHYLFDCS